MPFRLKLLRMLTLLAVYDSLEANYFNSMHLKKPMQKNLNLIQILSNENASLVSEVFPRMSESFARRRDQILSHNTIQSETVKYEKRTPSDFTGNGRAIFLRKIYLVYCVQMMATIVVTGAIVGFSAVSKLFYANWALLWLISFLGSSTLCSLLCIYPQLRRESPNKFVALGIQNCFQGVMIGSFSTLLQPKLVCLGTVHTVASLLSLALYTYASDKDLNLKTSASITTATATLVGLVLHFVGGMPTADNIISALLAIGLAMFIGQDSTGIINGQHKKYEYGKREYILVALQMYQDAINLGVSAWRGWKGNSGGNDGSTNGLKKEATMEYAHRASNDKSEIVVGTEEVVYLMNPVAEDSSNRFKNVTDLKIA